VTLATWAGVAKAAAREITKIENAEADRAALEDFLENFGELYC